MKTLSFTYLQHTYPVQLRLKRQKKIYFRYLNQTIFISAPLRTSQSFIFLQLEKVIEKLLIKPRVNLPIQPNGLYLFGRFIEQESLTSEGLPGDFLTMTTKDQQIRLKKILLPYIQTQYAFYHQQMKVETFYKVSIRTMKTRFGSHARQTKKLTFATHLVHYDYPSIDAVIVHELAHHFHFDHSPNFYQCLLQYFPRYKEVHAKLKAHQFHL